MRRRSNNKKYIILGLLGLVCLMTVGYAAFATNLTITGTAGTSSSWDVHIKNNGVTYQNALNGATSTTAQKVDNLTARIACDLQKPGSSIDYVITIENSSTMIAALNQITINYGNNSRVINSQTTEFDLNDYVTLSTKKSSLLPTETIAANGGTDTITLSIAFKDVTEQPTLSSDKDFNITVSLDFSQTETPVVVASPKTPLELAQSLTTDDGLYQDGSNYVFKGSSPKNWIKFNNEDWRIMSISSTGVMKIIREESLSTSVSFDSQNLRDSGSSGAGGTYCAQSSTGCNVWSKQGTDENPTTFVNGTKSGTVLLDSELKTYLNTTYLPTITTNSDKIVTGTFNIGASGTYNDTKSISQLQALEDDYQWTGSVGLATKSEYMNANTNSSCLTASALYSNYSTCKITNYLYKSYNWWLLSPNSSNAIYVLNARSNGTVNYYNATASYGVRPVLYLSSNIQLVGTGADSDHAFTIS